MKGKPDIFSYADYRAYLRDFYKQRKEEEPKFSYRSFAKHAGLASQSFLRDVIIGDKNIGQSTPLFLKALGLNNAESKFFKLLVDFDNAKTRIEKNFFFEKIAATKRFKEASRIDESMYTYLSHWYYPAIREMIHRDDFEYDAHWISKNLNPKIKVHDVRKALNVLLDLGFAREHEGTLISNDPILTTGHEATSLGVVNFHLQMLEKAGESIERFRGPDRDLGAMTICIRQDQIPAIKAKIHAFREEILHFADGSESKDLVVQFNTQLFPLNTLKQ